MSQPEHYQNYIHGEFVASQEPRIDVTNPANGELLASIPASGASSVEQAVASAKKAQQDWARKPAIERAGYLRQIAQKLRENQSRLAKIITQEQGKVLGLAEVEVGFAADYLDYMAEWARRIEGEVITSDRANETILLQRKPIGVVGGILPWNFPFFIIVRKSAPALITGNSIVINGDFASGLDNWVFETSGGAQASLSTSNEELRFQITNGGTEIGDVHLYQSGIPLTTGKQYRLEYDARPASPRGFRPAAAAG